MCDSLFEAIQLPTTALSESLILGTTWIVGSYVSQVIQTAVLCLTIEWVSGIFLVEERCPFVALVNIFTVQEVELNLYRQQGLLLLCLAVEMKDRMPENQQGSIAVSYLTDMESTKHSLWVSTPAMRIVSQVANQNPIRQ